MRAPQTMTRAEIKVELADLVARFDALRKSVEEHGGSGGSPGESLVERMGELETALKRGAYLPCLSG